MKKTLIIIGVVVIVSALFVVSLMKEEKGMEVSTEKVEMGTVIKKVTGSGQVKPAVEVKISANVSGKIINLTAEEGDVVEKGQLLVELERDQYEASLKRANSAMLSAIANEKKAASDLERSKKLYDQGLVSDAEYEAAVAGYDAQRGNREQMEASKEEATDQLRKTRLYATMDGVVTKLNKEQGEIAIGATFSEDVILIVSDLSVMESVIEIDENEVIGISLNDTAVVELDAFPDTTFKGIVTEIANSAITKGLGTQEQITNFEVTITIQNADARFRPGMSTTVDVYTEKEENILRVPIQSVTVREKSRLNKKKNVEDKADDEEESNADKDDKSMVEVVFVAEENEAVAKQVKLGISDDSHYAILSGINEGEQVITGPFKAINKTLKNGDKIKIKEKGKKDAD
ncbi:MAG: efflux RND transporter periplasmic adaptor subunit [Calditrichaeota bacterium]|nr:MAG: efflux RND transporter periplasmic adaptor subunit [Calditrichota bacterium]MBL1208088.1 efflux RND transporter periplasmic adaptor subunit [Calditrichota bacterium]NOG47926.1 efflux RND transporter periplasmic adaptor subunit [Calditrichota bacterium]